MLTTDINGQRTKKTNFKHQEKTLLFKKYCLKNAFRVWQLGVGYFSAIKLIEMLEQPLSKNTLHDLVSIM